MHTFRHRKTFITSFGLLLFSAATLPAGTLYVDDGTNVYRYSSNGTPSVFSNQPGSTVIGMAFDSSGNLYGSARDNSAIFEWSPLGVRSTFASVPNPYGMALDAFGNVYVGANFGNQINKYSPGGSLLGVFATGTNVQSLAFDGHGNLFEGDGSGNIYEYAPNGTRTTFASGLSGTLFGLAFDNAGNLYASDWNNEINKFTPGGTRSIFGTYPTGELASGLAYDTSTGTLYMAEVANGVSNPGQQKVYAFDSNGTRTIFATGLLTPFGIADLNSAPEPATFTLIGGALAAIGIRWRRRKMS